jgi:3-methyl-2-oxobutanoate hydroxymethyltransferase
MTTRGDIDVEQRPTVYDLLQNRGVRQLTQVHVMSVEEASACAEAGIDIVGTDVGADLPSIAAAAGSCFVQCGIPHGSISSSAEAIRAAFDALDQGASAIYTSASTRVVAALAAEGVPVVGHVGLVPNLATWTNFRAIGKTLDEATQLYRDLKRLEDAGAFAVEIEVVPAHIATELTRRTTMLTMSMGSGPGCNTQYLFSDDILGENTGHVPRHAKVYRDFAAKRRELHAEAVAAFGEFRADVAGGTFPAERHLVALTPEVRAAFDRFLTELA